MASNHTATQPTPAASGPGFGARAWRGLKRLLIYSLLALFGATALYLLAATSFVYSSGERAGYVQKFSKKGWVCKTWEGELALATVPGTMPERFEFTVRSDAVAGEINKYLGQRVTLHYEQHLGLPSCFGETDYWVTSVRPVTGP
jgi:hypothetical protein